jgi:hypothetical protein
LLVAVAVVNDMAEVVVVVACLSTLAIQLLREQVFQSWLEQEAKALLNQLVIHTAIQVIKVFQVGLAILSLMAAAADSVTDQFKVIQELQEEASN